MSEVVKGLLNYGVVGIFMVVLLKFAREVLLNIKVFLQKTQEENRKDAEDSRKTIENLTQKIIELHEEHRKHLILTQGELLNVISENTRAYFKLAESQQSIAKGNESVADAVNLQSKLIERLEFKHNKEPTK